MQNDTFVKFFDSTSRSKPFSGNEEYLSFLMTAFEFAIYDFLESDKTSDDNVYVSKRLLALSQLETRLSKKTADIVNQESPSDEQLNTVKDYITSRALRSNNLLFNLMYEKMKLDNFCAFCIIGAVYLFFEPNSNAIVQAISSNSTGKFTIESMARIYQKGEFCAIKSYPCMSKAVKSLQLLMPITNPELVGFATFSADLALINHLLSDNHINSTLCDIGEYIPSCLTLEKLYANENYVDEIIVAAKLHNILIVITGRANCGKRFVIKNATHTLNLSGYILDGRRFFCADKEQRQAFIWQLEREAQLEKIFCMFTNIDEISSEIDESEIHSVLSKLQKNLALLCISSDTENYVYNHDDVFPLHINIKGLTTSKRYELFCNFTNGIPYAKNVFLHEFANKYRFTLGQIKQAVNNCTAMCDGQEISLTTLKQSCHRLVNSGLGNRATLIHTPFLLDDVILPYSQKNQLLFACNQLQNQHIVYDDWGYSESIAYGKGTSILLYGPPGTGKTMAASAIANKLELELYRVDISKIVDKYIGETEKNIGEIFDRAKECSVVLFFDEADALFSKRSEVSNSNDRNANMETGFLLQCIEDYDGICILATNYKQNIDAAFLRRLKFTVEFPFPQSEIRLTLWQKSFPKNAPLDKEIDFEFLAQNFEISGGNIKNIAVNSAFFAAEREGIIDMKAIINCVYAELTKQHIIADSSCFAQYAHLLERE